ncbi:uncharacterized protein RJT21DRAFT_1153 [Scheffersomyces amazonensis]|uniref:uncharacterized protein n=1 Tax=Scheffersomyces amazonensis TaxID=1078765 RepID=UPI00315DEF1A
MASSRYQADQNEDDEQTPTPLWKPLRLTSLLYPLPPVSCSKINNDPVNGKVDMSSMDSEELVESLFIIERGQGEGNYDHEEDDDDEENANLEEEISETTTELAISDDPMNGIGQIRPRLIEIPLIRFGKFSGNIDSRGSRCSNSIHHSNQTQFKPCRICQYYPYVSSKLSKYPNGWRIEDLSNYDNDDNEDIHSGSASSGDSQRGQYGDDNNDFDFPHETINFDFLGDYQLDNYENITDYFSSMNINNLTFKMPKSNNNLTSKEIEIALLSLLKDLSYEIALMESGTSNSVDTGACAKINEIKSHDNNDDNDNRGYNKRLRTLSGFYNYYVKSNDDINNSSINISNNENETEIEKETETETERETETDNDNDDTITITSKSIYNRSYILNPLSKLGYKIRSFSLN